MGIMANQRELSSLSELVILRKTSIVRPCGRLDLPPSTERDSTRDPGTTSAYHTWWIDHMSSRFQQNRLESAPVVSAVENSDEDYDSDRSHPRKRRPSSKRPVGASSGSSYHFGRRFWLCVKEEKARKEVPPASFPLSPPTFLPPISETEPQISCPSSLEAPGAPQEEASSPGAIAQTISPVVVIPEDTEVVEEPAGITPALTQPETLPVQEVTPSPSVVQEEAEEEVVETPAPSIEAMVEVEAPPSAVEEGATTPAVEAPAFEVVAEVVQEEVPAIEEVADDAPAVEEASVVQDLATPILTSQEAPSQEFLSYVEGLMVQAWRDRIAPRMLSPGAVSDTSVLADAGFAISRLQEMGHDVTRIRVYTLQLQTLKEIERSAGEKARRTSRDEAESIARNTLAIVSSKLEEAKATLGEVIEELSEAKAEEEDARERLGSARTKVAYLTTQAEQIQESVRGLKTGVTEAERLIAEVITTPTLSAAEEATLLSSRAAFAELQQEMARNL
ncbi:hypothetical protein H6P81_016249 [Aristolochia fimbriata]|uniref:Uncharacterized protein n=1 Tax=Aristolochia fimbriata TaxID=158543 RepID=A0AAV7E9G7_ARIFI|nr:hypothetical protein H6P81_016249 [Aristolochia fimbriata]